MQFRLTSHVEQELRNRRIPRQILELVLDHPQQIVPERMGRKGYQSQLDFGDGRMYLVRAIVDETEVPRVVVTIYRTSKIAKYWRPV